VIVSGNRPDGKDGKHEWLEVDGIIVDITSDQFEGRNRFAVVVSRNSSWHAELNGRPKFEFDDVFYPRFLEERFFQFIRDMYDRIATNIGDCDQP
jgi:hypothetical protein